MEELKRQGYFVQDSATAHKLQIVAYKVSRLKSLRFLSVGKPKRQSVCK
jgi:hypothetical protein